MTIGKKLSLGFICVAVLVFLVGVISFGAMQILTKSTNTILESKLPIKDVAMEASISLINSRDATASIILKGKIQTDTVEHYLNELTMWMTVLKKGSESPEFRNSPSGKDFTEKKITIKAQKLEGKKGKDIVAKLDSSLLSYKTRISNVEELQKEKSHYNFKYAGKMWNVVDYMTLVELQHIKWLDQLRIAAEEDSHFSAQTDHRKCFFGKWFYSFKVTDPSLDSLLKELEPIHERLHASAIKINTLSGTEKIDEHRTAVLPIQKEIKEILAKILHYSQQQVTELVNREEKIMLDIDTLVETMGKELADLEKVADEEITEAVGRANKNRDRAVASIIFFSLLSIGLSLLIGNRIAAPISKSISLIVAMAKDIAKGKQIDINTLTTNHTCDEIRHLSSAFAEMADSLNQKIQILSSIADKDLTQRLEEVSEEDRLANSLEILQSSLASTLSEVSDVVNQVHIGAGQLSQSSAQLSEGASSQAASIEEISSAMTVVNEQAKGNTEMADNAKTIAANMAQSAEICNTQMEELSQMMESVKNSSTDISKVISIIDDIAFQTNLLALNASVEAARAGQHGKGFAVVAEEVRNLSQRSADAVRNTSDMISTSLKMIQDGVDATERTATTLKSMVADTENIVSASKEIAKASHEQLESIEEVGRGLDQISSVTQSNSASAEEGAASSEELSAQAELLAALVGEFTISTDNEI